MAKHKGDTFAIAAPKYQAPKEVHIEKVTGGVIVKHYTPDGSSRKSVASNMDEASKIAKKILGS